MNWTEIERRFNRALNHSFSKKKFFLTFPILVLCSLVVIFSRSLSISLSAWMSMSFVFLSVFLVSGIMLSLGVLLIRIYYHEVKQFKISVSRIIGQSWEIMIGASYLSIPPILLYLLLWILLGVFYILSQIPNFGEIVAAVLAFGPFILIFGAIILCILNLGILFFIAPAIGLNQKKMKVAKIIISRFQSNVFFHLTSLFLGAFPVFLISYLLYITAYLTNMLYSVLIFGAADPIRWFFISLPLCGVLAPFVIFFFNFAAEIHQLFAQK